MSFRDRVANLSIWWFAFGYFACYLPYSALTKAVSKGWIEGSEPVAGFRLLPLSVAASVVGMFVFITAMDWWRFAGRKQIGGRSFPCPNRWTLLSGLCTAAVIGTTTMAYTFEGASIVFMMLLMRGGVLILAPIVDFISKRHVRWFSWVALALSLAAVVVAFAKDGGFAITLIAAIDVIIYLASYFVRLRFMSRLAKSDDPSARTRYFVEEQMIASPAMLAILVVLAAIGSGEIMQEVRAGFTEVPGGPTMRHVILIGILSQGTGIFGGLVLLDRRENTFCVPVNRSSSIMAGVLATVGLWLLVPEASSPHLYDMAGAALIILAILALSYPNLAKLRRR